MTYTDKEGVKWTLTNLRPSEIAGFVMADGEARNPDSVLPIYLMEALKACRTDFKTIGPACNMMTKLKEINDLVDRVVAHAGPIIDNITTTRKTLRIIATDIHDN